MKQFDDYKDGDWVTYRNPKSEWHNMQFQAYKSKYTPDAFRLKFGTREVVADISEVLPMSETNHGLREDLQSGFQQARRPSLDADDVEFFGNYKD